MASSATTPNNSQNEFTKPLDYNENTSVDLEDMSPVDLAEGKSETKFNQENGSETFGMK